MKYGKSFSGILCNMYIYFFKLTVKDILNSIVNSRSGKIVKKTVPKCYSTHLVLCLHKPRGWGIRKDIFQNINSNRISGDFSFFHYTFCSLIFTSISYFLKSEIK